MRKHAALLAVMGVCALAQSPAVGPDISAMFRVPGQLKDVKLWGKDGYPTKWIHIDAPLTFTLDAGGNPHIGVTLPTVAPPPPDPPPPPPPPPPPVDSPVMPPISDLVKTGKGLLATWQEGGPLTIELDNNAVAIRRYDPPAGPGACPNPGRATMAADAAFLYLCVQDPSDTTGQNFIWARTPLATSW